jgi:hypothetical protein
MDEEKKMCPPSHIEGRKINDLIKIIALGARYGLYHGRHVAMEVMINNDHILWYDEKLHRWTVVRQWTVTEFFDDEIYPRKELNALLNEYVFGLKYVKI